MKHVGDITRLNGAELPVVDCITGGSPCQDLSVAGKRAGLAGERSGLFMEQITIIKEMRDADRNAGRTGCNVRPRYMVWENVPGAFSSNGGEDFRAVLEETAKVADEGAIIPGPPKGKWSQSGAIMGDGWSIAWRVHDAQYWGVPQRRKRIALVADFGGGSAPEILFERKGMRGDTPQGREERKSSSSGAGTGSSSAIGFNRERCGAVTMQDGMPTLQAAAGESGNNKPMVAISFQERAGKPGGGKGILIQEEHTGALSTLNNQSVLAMDMGGGKSSCSIQKDKTPTLATTHGGEPVVYDARGNGDGTISPTITGDHQNRITDYTAGCIGNGQADQLGLSDKVGALNCMHDQQAVMTYGPDRASYNQGYNASFSFTVLEDAAPTQTSMGPGVVSTNVVRRLTPKECERLQGFPDNWTDIGAWTDSKGKLHKESSDASRYKALGNSIATPFWFWLLRRISAQYERPATLGSLFDGIGGFPLCWEKCNGRGTALWASEIEEFTIAVTRLHFPEE